MTDPTAGARAAAELEAAVADLAEEIAKLQRTIAARDRRIARLVAALDYARAQGVVFPADSEPPVILSGGE